MRSQSLPSSTPESNTGRGFLFWIVLPDGRHNSLNTDSLYYAPQRARALGAKSLFVKNLATGNVAQMF